MINYNDIHLHKFFTDVITYFGGVVHDVMYTYIEKGHNDNQKKIHKTIINNQYYRACVIEYCLIHLTYNNKTGWIIVGGRLGVSQTYPSCYIIDKETNVPILNNLSQKVLNRMKDFLIEPISPRRLCNICGEANMLYTCLKCYNIDFCEKCSKNNFHEKIHMKKISDDNEDEKYKKILCDVCCRGFAKYFGNDCNDLYNICQDCYIDNPHKNHKLTKLEMDEKIKSDDKIIEILENSLYVNYTTKMLGLFNNDEVINLCKNKKLNRIFSDEKNSDLVTQLKIKKKVLDELKKIEKNHNERIDRIIRKYISHNYIPVICMCPDILIFYSNNNADNFYFKCKKMIEKSKKKINAKNDCNNDYNYIDKIRIIDKITI
jgi:hypothetical protein